MSVLRLTQRNSVCSVGGLKHNINARQAHCVTRREIGLIDQRRFASGHFHGFARTAVFKTQLTRELTLNAKLTPYRFSQLQPVEIDITGGIYESPFIGRVDKAVCCCFLTIGLCLVFIAEW